MRSLMLSPARAGSKVFWSLLLFFSVLSACRALPTDEPTLEIEQQHENIQTFGDAQGNSAPHIPSTDQEVIEWVNPYMRNLQFSCEGPGCNGTFEDMRALRAHEACTGHKTVLPRQCPLAHCDKRYRWHGELRKHLVSHFRLDSLSCRFCDRRFRYVVDRSDHEVNEHSTTPQCEICGLVFPDVPSLAIHQSQHNEVYPLACPTCGLGFKKLLPMEKHMLTHQRLPSDLLPPVVSGNKRNREEEEEEEAKVDEVRLVQRRRRNYRYACDQCTRSFSTEKEAGKHAQYHALHHLLPCRHCGGAYFQGRHNVIKDCPARSRSDATHSSQGDEHNGVLDSADMPEALTDASQPIGLEALRVQPPPSDRHIGLPLSSKRNDQDEVVVSADAPEARSDVSRRFSREGPRVGTLSFHSPTASSHWQRVLLG